MNKNWQEKLTSFGASVDSEGKVMFADETSASDVRRAQSLPNDSVALVDLSHLAVVDITGSDAQTFFQDQVCNDLTALTADAVQFNGYCTPKGRLLALFIVFKHDDGVRLLLPTEVTETITKRLQMFVLRAEVSVTVRADLICSGLVGSSASALDTVQLPEGFPDLPTTELQLEKNHQVQIMRWHDAPTGVSAEIQNQSAQPRFLVVAEPDVMATLWQSTAFAYRSEPYWRWGDINAGVPNVFASSSEQFIPQMLNMQFIDGLSFKKGCYPGQEIIARMQYLGKLKKHMRHLHVPNATVVLKPGDVLTTESNNNAGQVVDAVLDQDGLNLLAVLNIDTPSDELKIDKLGFVDASLPYSIVPEDTKASSTQCQ